MPPRVARLAVRTIDHQGPQLAGRGVEVIVDYHVIVIGRLGNLATSRGQPQFQVGADLGPAGSKTLLENLRGRRHQEDRDRVRIKRSQLTCPPNVDVEQDRAAALDRLLNGTTGGPVAIPVHLGPLGELTGGHHRIKGRGIDETVVLAFDPDI